METPERVNATELIIDHAFTNQEFVTRALTPAGAGKQSEESHDGNRLIAGYGRNAMERYELDTAYLAGARILPPRPS